MTTSEKVNYIKGLVDGLGIDTEKGEGKVISLILDVLEDLAYDVEDVKDAVQEVGDGLDAVSEDLSDVEDLIFGEDEDDEEHHHHGHHHGCDCGCEDDDYDYSVVCPSCGEELVLEDEDLESGVLQCPSCGETLELEFDECGEDCDCCDDDDDDEETED